MTPPGKRLSWAQRRRRSGEQQLAGDLVARVLTGYGVEREVREHRIVLEWAEVVGERVARRTWPDGLRDGVLWVRVASSAWLQELSFLRPQMVERANRLVGPPPLVREVRLHVGPQRRRDPDDVVAALARRVRLQRRRRRWRPTPASGAVLARIERETAAVESAELREAIRAARVKLGL